VGGTREISVDVRIIAATNKDLKIEVEEGRFRNDLFFRLQVIPIRLPPLREHPDHIPKLVEFFVDQYNAEFKKSVKGISTEAMEQLQRYPWPGNVRELRNILERILILENSERIEMGNLPPEIIHFDKTGEKVNLVDDFPSTGISLDDVEKELIQKALRMAGGNQTRAAELLGLSRDTLRYRLQKFDLKE